MPDMEIGKVTTHQIVGSSPKGRTNWYVTASGRPGGRTIYTIWAVAGVCGFLGGLLAEVIL